MPKVTQSPGGRPTVDSVEPSDHLGPFPKRAAPAAAPVPQDLPEPAGQNMACAGLVAELVDPLDTLQWLTNAVEDLLKVVDAAELECRGPLLAAKVLVEHLDAGIEAAQRIPRSALSTAFDSSAVAADPYDQLYTLQTLTNALAEQLKAVDVARLECRGPVLAAKLVVVQMQAGLADVLHEPRRAQPVNGTGIAAAAATSGTTDPRVPLLLSAMSEIAADAASLHVLLLHVFGGHEFALPGALAMTQKLGHLADTVASSMGEMAYCDAEEWLYSPRILKAMDQVKGTSHG